MVSQKIREFLVSILEKEMFSAFNVNTGLFAIGLSQKLF